MHEITNHIHSQYRYLHIDIAKGIGILAVIGLHTGFHVPAWVGWEMPLFFLISGIFANPHKKGFIISRINRLLVPACFFYAPIFLYNCAFYLINQGDISLYDCFMNCAIPSALWFLIALFYISIFHFIISQFINNKIWLVTIAIISFTIGYLLYNWQVPQLLFINTSITSFFFYLIGNIYCEKLKSLSLINKWLSGLLGFIMLISSWAIYTYSDSYIFYRNNELNADAYIIITVALLGIIGILLISVSLTDIKFLSIILNYFGKNSLVILCTHLYYLKLIQYFHFTNIMQFGIVTICMIPTIYILKHYFPKLSGFQPLFKLKTK